ncbi:hypothetical protein HMPREF0539_1817 [Lacticaseibacillus rhamnosus LMS2-1]|uniref:Uncharacterized protein n=1 Tax=Lacticaseibacillus rhamnosus (strain LMS2-1) TaxID=525361 RepID=C2JY32_LACRM|nr:hypothetical protein HMPREF0539_1817 [Lacticaseibacillus rhamnosus LMS2-1]
MKLTIKKQVRHSAPTFDDEMIVLEIRLIAGFFLNKSIVISMIARVP